MSKEIDKIVTPVFRVSFPEVWEPKAAPGSTVEKYSLTMLFKNTEDLSSLKALLKRAIQKKWDAELPPGFVNPLKDGNLKSYNGYENTIYASASSLYPPGVVDEQKQTIINRSDFYAGCYAIATVTAYVYFPTKKNPLSKNGVSFGLQNIMKINDGEPLGGGSSAEADFESIDLPDQEPLTIAGGRASILDL